MTYEADTLDEMDFQKRYEFDPKIDLLGNGAFSRVYKARDILLKRFVALKFFTAEATSKYQILNKVQKASKLRQHNLSEIYDVELLSTTNILGETESVVVAVMEYLGSGNFENYTKSHPDHLDKLFVDILMGLSYLHKHGIVHGNLRPQNVLITIDENEPVAKIIDFGISKLSDPLNPGSTAVMSTIEYMPPEHFNPKRYGMGGQITSNLDLWSFGLMVYEAISNNKLFGSVSAGSSEGEVMSNILYKFPLAQFNLLPRKYKDIVNKCIVKDAAERVQHASELIRVFEKYTDIKITSAKSPVDKKPGTNGHQLKHDIINKEESKQVQPTEGNKLIQAKEESKQVQTNNGTLTNKRLPDEKYASLTRRAIEEKQGSANRPETEDQPNLNKRTPIDGMPMVGPAIVRIEPEEQPVTIARFGIDDKKAVESKDMRTAGEGAYVIPPKEARTEPDRRRGRENVILKPPVTFEIDPPSGVNEPNLDQLRPRMGTRPPLEPLNRPSIKKLQIQKRKRRRILLFVCLALVLAVGIYFLEEFLSPKVNRSNKAGQVTANTLFETPEMIQVDGGSYLMGNNSSDAQETEKPAHTVILGSFLIGKYEVTVKEFSRFITDSRYLTTSDSLGFSWIYKQGEWVKGENVNWTNDIYGKLIEVKEMNVPVIHVSWIDAMNYCKWLSMESKLTFRLPTEAEWEFAARGGNNSKQFRFSGNDTLSKVAWYDGNSKQNLSKVGQKLPNELGLYDMSGNVMEWCHDYYDEGFYSDAKPENSFGPDIGSERVARGGSWFTPDLMCRTTFRMAYPESTRGGNIGFRICRMTQ